MRVSRLEQQDADASELREWAQFCKHIGDGTEPTVVMGGVQDFVRLPDAVCLPSTMLDMHTFSEVGGVHNPPKRCGALGRNDD